MTGKTEAALCLMDKQASKLDDSTIRSCTVSNIFLLLLNFSDVIKLQFN
jgi:hypothetical protein